LNDLVLIRDYLLGKTNNITETYKSAGDIYGENNITLNDLVGVMSVVSGSGTIKKK
jgi:hypothetical protein